MNCNSSLHFTYDFYFNFISWSNLQNLFDFHGLGRRISLAAVGGMLRGVIRLFPFSVTTPETDVCDTQKAMAAPGSPSQTPEEVRTPPEEDRPYLQPRTASEWGDPPIVQEPEEPPEHRQGAPPRKTSLVIVESADDQPPVFERFDEDAAFQKVRSSSLFLAHMEWLPAVFILHFSDGLLFHCTTSLAK